MSLTNNDRKFRSESGKMLPAAQFALAIAGALRRQYGGERSGLRAVGQLTGANERTVGNWFDARNGPNGESLIALCRHSDEVLDTVLKMAGRDAHARAARIALTKQRIVELLRLLLEEGEGG